jgi:hypothetical protein
VHSVSHWVLGGEEISLMNSAGRTSEAMCNTRTHLRRAGKRSFGGVCAPRKGDRGIAGKGEVPREIIRWRRVHILKAHQGREGGGPCSAFRLCIRLFG